MARLLYTVDNLVQEVRGMLDEANTDSVSTSRDILPAINRANTYAFDILARRYPQPILQPVELELIGGQTDYDIPENVFEDRIAHIEMAIPSGNSGRATYRAVQEIDFRQATDYETPSTTNLPFYFVRFGRKIRFIGVPSGTYNARLWQLVNPEKYVLPQGRITRLNATTNYIILDQVGSSLTTEVDQLGSYVNVIDGQTGIIKGTLQIQSLGSDNRVSFRSVPMRSEVLGRTVSGSIAALPVAMELDDYLSAVDGTCVPFYGLPLGNFLIQYAVAEITRKLGGAAELESQVLEKFEKQIEKTYANRPSKFRITKTSRIWGLQTRRFWWE